MKSKKITISILPDTNLSSAICRAMNPQQAQCRQSGLHQTMSSSIHQELIDAKKGTSAYENAVWRSQIGVMLG